MNQVLSDAEYADALQRVRDFRKQLAESAALADQGSLAVARDLTRIFEDGRWVNDLPPVKRSHVRGRPVDPLGRSRFATWCRDPMRTGGYAPATTYQFLNAAKVADEFLPRAERIQDASEFVLRPLASLMAKGRTDDIKSVWQTAERRAGGVPTADEIRAVIRERFPSLTATKRCGSGERRDWSDVIISEFRDHLLKPGLLRSAGELLDRMVDEYNEAVRNAREEKA